MDATSTKWTRRAPMSGFLGTAAIKVIIFGGFILVDISIMTSMGFGLASAVPIDAVIAHGLLPPATMRLMDAWNWRAPGPARNVVDRLSFGHQEAATTL